jgi:hypothetical protein
MKYSILINGTIKNINVNVMELLIVKLIKIVVEENKENMMDQVMDKLLNKQNKNVYKNKNKEKNKNVLIYVPIIITELINKR